MHSGWFRSFKNLSASSSSDKAVNAGQEAAKTFFSRVKTIGYFFKKRQLNLVSKILLYGVSGKIECPPIPTSGRCTYSP